MKDECPFSFITHPFKLLHPDPQLFRLGHHDLRNSGIIEPYPELLRRWDQDRQHLASLRLRPRGHGGRFWRRGLRSRGLWPRLGLRLRWHRPRGLRVRLLGVRHHLRLAIRHRPRKDCLLLEGIEGWQTANWAAAHGCSPRSGAPGEKNEPETDTKSRRDGRDPSPQNNSAHAVRFLANEAGILSSQRGHIALAKFQKKPRIPARSHLRCVPQSRELVERGESK